MGVVGIVVFNKILVNLDWITVNTTIVYWNIVELVETGDLDVHVIGTFLDHIIHWNIMHIVLCLLSNLQILLLILKVLIFKTYCYLL